MKRKSQKGIYGIVVLLGIWLTMSLSVLAKEQVVTITLAGDCSLGKLSIHGYEGTFYETYDRYGPEYFFQNVKTYFEKDDMTLINFEGVLTDSDNIVEKQYNIKGRPEFISILPVSGIDAVTFGNNHRIDYGEQGIADTVAAFKSVNVPYAYDSFLGLYTTKQGATIGYVSVNQVYDLKSVEPYLQSGIQILKEQGADIVLACPHWGIEMKYYPDSYQQELGRKCIDWGADMVVGSHPHVLQGIDFYSGKYIIYSLGNFCFGGNRNPKDKNTMMVQARFVVDPEKKTGVVGEALLETIPCTISSVDSRNNYCPTPAVGKRRDTILNNLNQYSKPFQVSIDRNGIVHHIAQ